MLGILDGAGMGAAVNVGGVLGSRESSCRVAVTSDLMTEAVSLAGPGSVGAVGVAASVDSLATDSIGEDTASFSVGGNDGSWLGSFFTFASSKSDRDSSADDSSDKELKSIKSLSMSDSTGAGFTFFFLLAGRLLSPISMDDLFSGFLRVGLARAFLSFAAVAEGGSILCNVHHAT